MKYKDERMTTKLKFKIIIDILNVLLQVLMAYALTGHKVHELIGAVMFVAFVMERMNSLVLH